MKKLLAALMILVAASSAAQTYSYGIDLEKDEKAFADFKRKMAWKNKTRPTVALVLSGGGAKGAAHISVIKAIEQVGIPVDMVIGTSIGGLIGGLYACGYTGNELEEIIRNMDWDYLLGDTHPRKYDSSLKKEFDSRYMFSLPFGSLDKDLSGRKRKTDEKRPVSLIPDGIVQGQNVRNLFSSLTVGFEDEMDFLTLPIPFVCVASDMVTARSKVWHSGRLCDAMRSTMSIPGLFAPMRLDGMVLMDGGMQCNFPAEIAKKMGANIIIGVDISAPAYTADEINNLMDIVFQTMDVLGRESYEAGIEATTVYIKPELSDFNMLSFDEKSIDIMIDRGKDAAEKALPQLREVQKKVHKAKAEPASKKAVNFLETPVSISGVDFTGVSVRDRIYLRKKLNLGRLVTKSELDAAVAELLGSSAFKSVTYDILGTEAPYQIRFNCKMAPVSRFGAGVRFDTYEYTSLLLNAGFNATRLTGSRFDITARLGLKSTLQADYALRTSSGLDWCLSAMGQHVSKGIWSVPPYDFQIDYSRAKAGAFARFSRFKFMTIKAGAALDWYKFNSFLVDFSLLSGGAVPAPAKSNAYLLGFLQANWDTFDDVSFPKNGMRWDVRGEYVFKALSDAIDPFFTVKASIKGALPARIVTILPWANIRYVSGTSTPFLNFLSVELPGRMLDQQIPFVGLNKACSAQRFFASTGLEARVDFASKHHISLKGEVGRMSDKFLEFFDSSNDSFLVGAALEYAFQTVAGPIKFNVHWSNVTQSVGAYLSLGLDF